MPMHSLFAKSTRQLLCCVALFLSGGLHAASPFSFESAFKALIIHIDAAQPHREDRSLQEITVSADELSIALPQVNHLIFFPFPMFLAIQNSWATICKHSEALRQRKAIFLSNIALFLFPSY